MYKLLEDYKPKKVGQAYKVFKVKNGKLYPPMVANPGNADTPIGVWLQAQEGEFAGTSKTGRPQVKSIGSGTLSYRPGWHLGDLPRAKQFDRLNKETGEYEFPKDFVWALCDYVMDVDYQKDSDEQGYMRTKKDDQGNIITYRSDKYQHSLAGLPKLPKDGYYRYRTNPNPDTVPWVITGAIKVNRLLDDFEVNEILKQNGIEPIHRQGGDKTLSELGLTNVNEDLRTRYAFSYPKEDKIKYNGFVIQCNDNVYTLTNKKGTTMTLDKVDSMEDAKRVVDNETSKAIYGKGLTSKFFYEDLEEAYDISTKNDLELLEDDLDDLLDKLEREGYGVWPYNDSYRGYGFKVYSAKRKLTKDEDIYYFFDADLARHKLNKYKTFNPNILDGKLVSTKEFNSVDELDSILHNEIESINPQNTIIDAQIEEDLTDEEQSLLDRIDKFITKLYELRQSSIKEEGEFGTGNLVFKEFRNLGYLDNLKKLKTKLQGKEMSLEGLKEELLERGDDRVYSFESPYQAKDFLLSKKDAQRIFIDEKIGLYLIDAAFANVHTDMVEIAKANGYDTKFNEWDNKQVCLLYVPNEDNDMDEDSDILGDGYDTLYEYDGFKIYSREQDFSKFALCDIMGEHTVKHATYKELKDVNGEHLDGAYFFEGLNESKTFRFPNLQQAIDYYWKDSDVKVERVPIKKLVDDNNLLDDEDLQSYHQRLWDNKPAKEFSIDKSKINSMRLSEVPYAVRHKDGKIELGDGRHRTRALYNDGYEYVELPIISEEFIKQDKEKEVETPLNEKWITRTSEELNESTNTEEYKFYEMLTKISGQLKDSQKLARMYPSLNKEVIDKFNEINSRYDKAEDNASRNKISLEAESLMDEVLNNKEKYLKGLDQGISDSNIDLMLDEMLKLPQHELLDKCGMGDTFDKPELVGPMFILDDGSFVYVSHYVSGYITHLDFVKQMIYNYAKNVYPNVKVDIHLYSTSENFMYNLLKKGWVRCNTGSSASDRRFYCVLPDKNDYKPTNEQFYSLAYFLDLNDTDRVLVFCGDYESRYYYKEDGSDYIVNRIKRYYNDGELRESLLESKQDKENFKKWITQKVEDKYAGMPSGNKEAFINNWVNSFEEDKSALKPPLNDYYYWIKKDDWDAFTAQMFHLNIDKENKQKAKDGAQLIYNKDGWQVYKITNYQASAKYGKGTRWCISGSKRWSNDGSGEKYWNEYSEAGVVFYFFINGNRKYALAIYPDNTTYEIFDDGDNSLGYIPNAPIIEEIPVDYTSKNDYREFYNAVASAKLPDWQYIYGRVYSELTSGEKDDVDILDKDVFLDYEADYLIPDGYIEHDACENGLITPEEYKDLTGDEYDNAWYGDLMSNTIWNLIDMNDITTKDEALDCIAKSLKDAKYVIYDRYSGDVESFDNYEDLIVYIIQACYEWDNYKDGFDQFVDSCINITRLLIKQGELNIDDFTKLGISKEFLEKEE